MAILQARGVNVAEPAASGSLAFTGNTTNGSTLFAALYYTNGTSTPPSNTPPDGWTLVRTEQVFASALYGQLFTRPAPSGGGPVTFAVTFPVASAHAIGLWEVSGLGAQVSVTSGDTDDSGNLNTGAVTTQAGGDVFAMAFQNAFGAVFSSTDTLVVAGDATNTRMYVVHRVADAATESFAIPSSQGGFAGWMAISFAPGSTGPDVVEGAGTLSGGGSLSAAGIALGAGTYVLNAGGALAFTPPIPNGGYLRLLGVESGLACWVQVVGTEGGAAAPETIYVVDAQQPGDDSLAALVDAEQAATGSVEIRHYS